MKIRFLPTALEQLERANAWWTSHRAAARFSFAEVGEAIDAAGDGEDRDLDALEVHRVHVELGLDAVHACVEPGFSVALRLLEPVEAACDEVDGHSVAVSTDRGIECGATVDALTTALVLAALVT